MIKSQKQLLLRQLQMKRNNNNNPKKRLPTRLPKLQRRRLQRTSRKLTLINKRLRKQLLLPRLNTTEKSELRLKN
jgi:hypothetical protein